MICHVNFQFIFVALAVFMLLVINYADGAKTKQILKEKIGMFVKKY